jgi:hypothetical protein
VKEFGSKRADKGFDTKISAFEQIDPTQFEDIDEEGD